MTVYENKLPNHANNIYLGPDHKLLYDKQSPDPSWRFIDYGFLWLDVDFLRSLPRREKFDLALPLSEFSKKGQVIGYPVIARFWEIGTPQALNEFRARLNKD
jgi:hypothetical protein